MASKRSSSDVRDFVADNAERYIAWHSELCSIPSLADDPAGLKDAVAWLQECFDQLGADTETLAYESAPETLLARLGTGDKTLLIYDHYDVQPVDPIELWDSKPFEPQIRDGRIYARGAADNKGDLTARLCALDCYQNVYGELPLALKFLIEGEEETGSTSFEAIINRYGGKLNADGCIWEGYWFDNTGRPGIVFGVKGLAYIELSIRGLSEDQHSSIAAIAPSPAWRLLEAVGTLRSADGTVLIDGFYDDVLEPTQEHMEVLRNHALDEDAEKRRLGIDRFVGDATGLDLLTQLFFKPTCNLAGIVAGYIVPGASKTVLPKEALAKLDMRLVPDQDPHDVCAKVRRHLDARGFNDIQIAVLGAEHPVLSPMDSEIGAAAIGACDGLFEREPSVSPLMTATGPMYPIAHTLGIPTVSPAGVTRPDSNIHAPNEQIRVDDYLRIIEYTVAYLRAFAGVNA